MENKRYFVFRTDDNSKTWLSEELNKGRLRQGWGIPRTQLIENGKEVPWEEWKERYKKSAEAFWEYLPDDDDTYKRWRILYPLTEMKVGDIIVVPKMPDWQSFIIAEVEQTYIFDFENRENEDDNDYRHIIHIKNNYKSFHYSSSIQAKTISAKFRAYQSAINNVWNDDFKLAVDELLQTKGDNFEIKSIKDIFSDIKTKVIKSSVADLVNLSPNDIEEIVATVFGNAGFEIVARNHFDGEGGDADLILTKPIPLISDYADEFSLKINVQIKKKTGIDYDDIDGVNQLIKISENDLNSIKILISLADSFTKECQAKAKEYNIILIPGNRFIEMAMKYL